MRKWIDLFESSPTVYHGTRHTFDVFDMSKARDGAHFFTTNREHAEHFGPARAYKVVMNNPMTITQTDLEDCVTDEDVEDDVLPRDYVPLFIEKAKQAGHDGLIIRDFADVDYEVDVYLPFTPEQIIPEDD